MFGANLHNETYDTTVKTIAFFNRINPEFDEMLFYIELQKIVAPIKLWYKYVKEYCLELQLTPSAKMILRQSMDVLLDTTPKDYNYLYNGVNFIPKDHPYFRNSKKLSSFLLQGIESSFIFHLLSANPDVCLSYEFDGLVVNKEIEEDLVEEARRISGFTSAKLIVKDFDV